jgi:curved DNA-binding protein CbpA
MPGSRIPRPVQGVETRALPIGPEEAYVLSRIDGLTSEADIVASTGLDPERVRAALGTLEKLGAVCFDTTPVRMSARPIPRPSNPALRLQAAIETEPERGALNHPAAALYDPHELDEEVDLDLPKKRRILDLYYRLEALSHYELLGLDAGVDRKAVKAAYYEVVGVFHPDRYFGKSLGSFKPKLEKVFARLTLAHDVLSRSQARVEYDAYLETQRKNEHLERMLGDDALQEAELERARRLIEEEARRVERIEAIVPPPAPVPSDPEARRRALARKLGRSTGPLGPATASMPPAAESTEQMRERVTQDLRRRFDQRVQQAKSEQVQRYVRAADAAIAENKAVSAANALRIAVQLAPEDQTLAQRLAEVQEIASMELSDSYVEQAQYEERNGRFAEAARSYERATAGKSAARLHERVAHCLVEAHGDLRQAADHAKKAVSMAPSDAGCRLTLGRVYLAAAMKQSALSEIERAAALAPGDASIREWLKRARRGDV